jgi:hypothetical protein
MCYTLQNNVLSLKTFIQFGEMLTPKKQNRPKLWYILTYSRS